MSRSESYHRVMRGGRIRFVGALLLCVFLARISLCGAAPSMVITGTTISGVAEDGGAPHATNIFRLLTSKSSFLLRLTTPNDPDLDYTEYGMLGPNFYSLTAFNANRQSAKTVNKASLTIYPGPVCEETFGHGVLLWLAMFGGDYYYKTNVSGSPVLSVNSDFNMVTPNFRHKGGKVKALWRFHERAPAYLETLAEINDGLLYSDGIRGGFETQEAKALRGKTNLFFSVNEWTNCACGWVPKRFRLEAFEPAADKKTLALASYMEGWVDSIGESKEIIAANPRFPERSMVYDNRYELRGKRLLGVSYLSTNGSLIPPAKLKLTPIYSSAVSVQNYQDRVEKRPPPNRWFFLALLAAVPLIMVLWRLAGAKEKG